MKILDAEVNKKSYITLMIVSILIVFAIFVVYYISFFSYDKYEMEEETLMDIEPLNVHIDVFEVSKNKSKVEIAGWAYKEDETIKTINSYYVLINEETGEKYILKTRRENNINVPKEYKKSGLHTRFLTKGLSSGRYDIYVLYKNNDNNLLNNTGIYLDI